MLVYIIILTVFFFLAWIFNGFETGLISLDRFSLEKEAKKSKLKKQILDFYDHPDKHLGTILIGYNISHVIIAAVATMIFNLINDQSNALINSLIITSIVLVFCEILPKNLFRDFPNTFVDMFFPLINASYYMLKPLVSIVTLINKQLKKLYKIEDNNSFTAFTKDDLAYMFAQTFNEGKIQQPQKEMLEDALEFNELIAKNVMIPRMDIVAIPDTMPYNEILKIAKNEGYTRYPVYHETLDEITGVLIIYDLLKRHPAPTEERCAVTSVRSSVDTIDKPKTENRKPKTAPPVKAGATNSAPSVKAGGGRGGELTARDLQREMFFVPESTDVDVLLKEMQAHKKTMAVVVDAYGGTSGIVTIEDILEQIVGDIDDEYDINEPSDVQQINDHTWIVNAIVKVDDLNDDYDLTLPEGDYETIAGLIISHLAKIPSRGQVIKLENYRFEILEVTNKKIVKVKITKQ